MTFSIKLDTANAIAQDAGTKFVRSTEDASWATKRALPIWQATDIERRLTEAGMVKVTAEWRDFSAYDTLCACSYESEEAFRADGYYADMAATALNELAERIESAKESVDALILHNDSRPKRVGKVGPQ